MHRNTQRFIFAVTLLISCCLFASGSYADPPSRVGRMSYLQGRVSFSPAGENVWVNAQLNRPLVAGDRIWANAHARAELQLGSAALRIEDETSLRIINLNDHIAQIDISQGTLQISVRQLNPGQIYEIDTPHLAFNITKAGDYRFDVDDNGNATTVTVRSGKGIAYAKNVAYKMKSGSAYRFTGRNLSHTQYVAVRGLDSFDRWSSERERRATKSRSIRYVSTTVIGYEDLDTYGSWTYVRGYGNAWTPHHVPAGWAPYR